MERSLDAKSAFAKIAIHVGMILLVMLVFWRSLASDYLHWDDDRLVARIPIMEARPLDALRVFWTSFVEGDYIPLPLSLFYVEKRLFGDTPLVHHAGNLLWHLVNVGLLTGWLGRLKVPSLTRWIVVFIFAVHPLQVESVMWISDRKSLLNAALIFGTLHAYETLKTAQRWVAVRLVLFWGAFALAALCKTTALFLPLALMAADFGSPSQKEGGPRIWLAWGGALVGVAMPFGLLRYWALAQHVGIEGSMVLSPSRILSVAAMASAALGHYVESFVWPFSLAAIYPDYDHLQEPGGMMLRGLGVLLIWGLWVWRRAQRLDRFVFFWFGLLLIPVLHVVPRANFVNDRYMYLPIIGLAYACGTLVLALWTALGRAPAPFRLVFGAGLLACLVVLPVTSWERTGVWQNDTAFWADAVARTPTSALAWNNYALNRRDQGLFAESHAALVQGLAAPRSASSPREVLYGNLGDLYMNPQFAAGFDPTKALISYEKGLSIAGRPANMLSLRVRMARALAILGRKEEAHEVLRSVLGEGPRWGSHGRSIATVMAAARSLLAEVEGLTARPE